MSLELDVLARWAIGSYANNRDEENAMLAPLLTIVGGMCDALVTTGDDAPGGDADIDKLAFLIGYIGYPCDAVYLTATWEALSVEASASAVLDGPRLIPGAPPAEVMDTARQSILCWAHCVPTRESVLLMRRRHVDDDGSCHWREVAAQNAADLDVFLPMHVAAHAYDQFPVHPDATARRREALAYLHEANGATHDSMFYPTGTLLEAAKRWTP